MSTDPPAGSAQHPGRCLQPVLLRGRVDHIDGATGELLHRCTTVHESGGVLPIACKPRRDSQCPPYAEVYRADTYQLIRAGLSGGKGVPDTVAAHPCVFTTLTAPSFGPVHVQREKDGRLLRCRPRRRGQVCPHGNRLSCPEKHSRDDACLGEPLCSQCYDYAGAVLNNTRQASSPGECGDQDPPRQRGHGRSCHRTTVRIPGVTGSCWVGVHAVSPQSKSAN